MQNAIGAIHRAKGADVQNFIAATLIRPRAGATSNERSFVLRYVKGLFPSMDRVIGTKKGMKHFLWIRDNFRRNLQPGFDSVDFGVIKNLSVN